MRSMRIHGKPTCYREEVVMQFLAELIALIFALGIKHRKIVGVALFAFAFSVFMLGVASTYGRSPVPFPLLFVLIGTIFILGSWKS